MAFWIAIVLLLALAVYAVSLYLRLAAYRRQVGVAWSDIAVQMKRRYDLIPGLVRAAQACASPARETLDAVIAARDAALSAKGADRARAETGLTEALARFAALTAHYADLRNNETFNALWHELTDSERRMRSASRHYNRLAGMLNAAIARFPSNLLAGVFDFEKASLFAADSDGTALPAR